MTRRARIWLIVAVLFSLVNVAGAVFAGRSPELIHATVHIALAFLGAAVALWISLPREAAVGASTAMPREIDDRLTRLEQTVEDVALSVERVGEGQRFIGHVVAEGGIGAAHREPAAARTENEAQDDRRG